MVSSDALKEHLEEFRLWLEDADFTPLDASGQTWNGSISVEWLLDGRQQTSCHKVSIILPAGFPYRAPIVLSKDDPPLAASWHLAPEPARSLCLWDSQTGWQPHFTAQRLLARIEDWFIHYHTDSWPANSEMPDLHRYLEKVGVVVIGDEWKPPRNGEYGKFTLWRHPKFWETVPSLASCDAKQFGPMLQPEIRLANNLLFFSKHERVAGVWFRLPRPFVPPNNLSELLHLIEVNLGCWAGWARDACIRAIGHKASRLPIAIAYPDNQGVERWLFLWAELAKGNQKKKISSLNLSQIAVYSFQTAPAKKEELLRRSAYLSQRLNSRRVVIFGVGALGGSVALLLAKAGMGEIRLVDYDRLMPGNVMRHVCGLQAVGLKKTKAVEQQIHQHNPDCDVHGYDSTWKVDELQKLIEGCDIVIDTTANYQFSLYLNEVCIALDQPVIFSAAYRRAAVGRIMVRGTSDDPCLACYVDMGQFWNEDQYPIIPPDPEAIFIEDGCGEVTEEAVALDVEAVANLTARIAIKTIQKQLPNQNLAILVNEPLAGTSGILAQPGTHWRSNKPLAECAICRG